jgi:hypothetical protein
MVNADVNDDKLLSAGCLRIWDSHYLMRRNSRAFVMKLLPADYAIVNVPDCN